MHGTYECNMAMQNCDVLLAIGASLTIGLLAILHISVKTRGRLFTLILIHLPFQKE